jgi:hypothetical protein
VVVGMHRLLAAHLSTEYFNCAIGDNFVRIHIRLGSRTSLPDYEGKVVDQLEIRYFGGCLLNGFANLGICRSRELMFYVAYILKEAYPVRISC